MDSFDYKPELFKADGKLTGIGGGLSNQQRTLLKPLWDFKPAELAELLLAICSLTYVTGWMTSA